MDKRGLMIEWGKDVILYATFNWPWEMNKFYFWFLNWGKVKLYGTEQRFFQILGFEFRHSVEAKEGPKFVIKEVK